MGNSTGQTTRFPQHVNFKEKNERERSGPYREHTEILERKLCLSGISFKMLCLGEINRGTDETRLAMS